MKTFLKWFGIAAVIVVSLLAIAYVAIYIYHPGSSAGWIKPGIAQKEIPAGVDTAVVFENVTVIPMDSERVLEAQTVVIENQRITAIGPSAEIEIPADVHVVDGNGRFLIPGLSDMHVHTAGSENDLLLYIANGVTTIRTMGSEAPVVLEWRDQIRDGTRIGPNMWVWWPQVVTPPWEDEWGTERATRGGKRWVHSPEEAEQLVAEMAALGVDGIKAWDVFPSEIYMALLESAAIYGLPFDGHAPVDHIFCPDDPDCVFETSSDAWNDFRTMGIPALAHVEELVKIVDQSEYADIRQMAQDAAADGLWVTTTVYLMRSIADQASDLEGTLAAMPEVKYVHPGVFDGMKWGPGENYYIAVGSRPWYPDYLVAIEKMTLALSESGALMMSGTDANSAVMVPGFSLHDELEMLSDIGMAPYDILKTSTSNPARYLGELEEYGTIEVGKRADLVLLEANPLQDIANTRQIAGVLVQGRYFSQVDLDNILESVAKDNEATEKTQTVLEIAFPILLVLFLVALGWFVIRRVRRRKSAQAA